MDPGPANGTAVVPFQVTLQVSGLLCLQDTTFTVPLLATGSVYPATLHPDSLTFTVPAGRSLAGFTQTRDAVLAVGPAPPDATAQVRLMAAAPQGDCPGAGPIERSGDDKQVMLEWPTVPPGPPIQAMPFSPIPIVLAAFLAIGWVSRRMGLNSLLP